MKTFLEYLGVRSQQKRADADDQAVRKTLEFSHDEMRVVIDITLTKHEQHQDAVDFLRQVASQLELASQAVGRDAEPDSTQRLHPRDW